MKIKEITLLNQIESLSELELSELLNDIADHLYRNKLMHLVSVLRNEEYKTYAELKDRVEELESELASAEDKLEDIRMIL